MPLSRLALIIVAGLLTISSAPPAPAGHPPAYAFETYHPFAIDTYEVEPRITVTTQQVCTPAEQPLILHTLTSEALGQQQAVDLRFTGEYTDVAVLFGLGEIAGRILTWTPTAEQPMTVVSLTGGRCKFIFPIVFLSQAPARRVWLAPIITEAP